MAGCCFAWRINLFKILVMISAVLLLMTDVAKARNNPFGVVISPGRAFKAGGTTENELSLVIGDPMFAGPGYGGGGSGPYFSMATGRGDHYRYFGGGVGMGMFPIGSVGFEMGKKTWSDQVVQNYKMLYFNVLVFPIAFVRQIDEGNYYELTRPPLKEYGLMFKIPIPVFAFVD
jgi:hypothetical protein